MHRDSSKLYLYYGVALLAAPLFCILYIYFFSIQNSDPWWLFGDLPAFGMLVLFYPLIEELSFRGVIQGSLSQRSSLDRQVIGLSLANILTSVLFVLMHFVHHPPVWALLVFFPSLVFGYFKDRFSSMIPSIILHSFYNLLFFSLIGR